MLASYCETCVAILIANALISIWGSSASPMVRLHCSMILMQFFLLLMDYVQLSSLIALQDWVSRNDIQKFEILLCIGNKVDLIPGHPVHAEYRRRLQKLEDSSADPHTGFYEFGISETEGSSLLGGEDPDVEIKRSCLEWCTEHNIEYIEACAANADFDKCKFFYRL